MEFYSTTLWHLQKEIELSYLAQELTEIDKNSPEVWKQQQQLCESEVITLKDAKKKSTKTSLIK